MTTTPLPASPQPPDVGSTGPASDPQPEWAPTPPTPAVPAKQPGKWRAYLILGGIGVFHVAEYTGGSTYPISLTLNSFMDTACVPVLRTYVGVDLDSTEDLTIRYFYLSRDGWDAGDRTVTCYAVRVDDAKLTKSLKGSAGS